MLPYEEKSIHQQFINGGIERAVQQLLAKEKSRSSYVLAFSIGGTIAWKAGLRGLAIQHCFAISANRLRYETQQAKHPVHLYYGQDDPYRPQQDWLDQMNVNYRLIPGKGHLLYKDPTEIEYICQTILRTQQTA